MSDSKESYERLCLNFGFVAGDLLPGLKRCSVWRKREGLLVATGSSWFEVGTSFRACIDDGLVSSDSNPWPFLSLEVASLLSPFCGAGDCSFLLAVFFSSGTDWRLPLGESFRKPVFPDFRRVDCDERWDSDSSADRLLLDPFDSSST